MNISHSSTPITPAALSAESIAPKLPASSSGDWPASVATPGAGAGPLETEPSVVAILGYN